MASRSISLVAMLVVAFTWLVTVQHAPADEKDPPKPKSDAEQLVGNWGMSLKEIGTGLSVSLVFRDDQGGQLVFYQLEGKEGDKKRNIKGLAGAGFKYKVETRGGKKLLLLESCNFLEGKAEIEYEFVGGKLRLKGGKTNDKPGAVIEFKGDYTKDEEKKE